MKLLTKEEEDAHQAAVVSGGIRGGLYSVAAMIPLFGAAYKFSPLYRAAPLPLKAFGAILVFAPSVVIEAESAGTRYERSLWTGAGKEEIDEKRRREVTEWDQKSRSEKIKSYCIENQWSLVGGAWVASMVGSGAYFYSNPYLTNAQRVVNSRMVAQGLTVALILTSAYITYQPKELDEPIKAKPDHSWKYMLEANAKEEAQEKAQEDLEKAHEKFRETKSEDPAKSAQSVKPM